VNGPSRRSRRPLQPPYPDDGIRPGVMDSGAPAIVGASEAAQLVRTAEALRRGGQFQDAQTSFRRALSGAHGRVDTEVMCWALWGQATSLRNRAEYGESERLYISTMATARSSGMLLCERWCLAGLAEIDRMRGRLYPALHSHEELATLFRRENDSRGLGWALSGLAQIHLNLGHTHDAESLFSEAEAVATGISDHISSAYAVRGRAEVALRQEDLPKARRLALAAREAFEAVPYLVGTAYAVRTLSHSALAEKQFEVSISLAKEAQDIFVRLKKPRGLAYMEQTFDAIARLRPGADGAAPRLAATSQTANGLWLAPLPGIISPSL